jgi:hypothetical protein
MGGTARLAPVLMRNNCNCDKSLISSTATISYALFSAMPAGAQRMATMTKSTYR